MIPSEYMDITYLILKVLNRPLKWGTARLWTPTGFKNTSRQSWTFEKNLCFTTKTNNVQLWRLVEADPGGVQRRAVSHFKGLFKTFKMRYSMSMYSYWIGFHVHFKKAILLLIRYTCIVISVHLCNSLQHLIFIFLPVIKCVHHQLLTVYYSSLG